MEAALSSHTVRDICWFTIDRQNYNKYKNYSIFWNVNASEDLFINKFEVGIVSYYIALNTKI